jgi:hypothetical protein
MAYILVARPAFCEAGEQPQRPRVMPSAEEKADCCLLAFGNGCKRWRRAPVSHQQSHLYIFIKSCLCQVCRSNEYTFIIGDDHCRRASQPSLRIIVARSKHNQIRNFLRVEHQRYPRLERVVAEARKHHAVIGNRRDIQRTISVECLSLGVRILQADLVPTELTDERLVPKPGGPLFHYTRIAYAGSGRRFACTTAVGVQRIAVTVAVDNAGRGRQKVSLRAFLFFPRKQVNIQLRRRVQGQAGQCLDFADGFDVAGCVESDIGKLSRAVTANTLAAHAG